MGACIHEPDGTMESKEGTGKWVYKLPTAIPSRLSEEGAGKNTDSMQLAKFQWHLSEK